MSDLPEVPDVPDTRTVRYRQYLTLAGLAAVVVLALVWLLGGGDDEPQPTATEKPVVKKIEPPAPVDPQQAWVARGERELEELRQERDAFWRELEALRKEIEQVRSSQNDDADQQGPSLPPLPPRPVSSSSTTGGELLPPQPENLLPPPPPPPSPEIPEGTVSGNTTKPMEGIMEIDVPGPSGHPGGKRAKNVDNYIPAGSFGRVLLLSGLDAPTGGQAQSDPVPFIVRLKDHGRLPNGFRSRVRDCHIVLAGYGDISSERVYARTEKLSCVLYDGRVVEVPIEGYIAGEDGKAGMRGRLVSKQGALIARSLLAGVAGGIGSGISQSYTTQSTSPLGTTQTVDPDRIVERGLAEGVGNALDRISRWYLDRADETYPILEVDAGRVADVVLVGGAFLDEEAPPPRRSMVTEQERRKAGTIETRPWRGGGS